MSKKEKKTRFIPKGKTTKNVGEGLMPRGVDASLRMSGTNQSKEMIEDGA